MLSELEQKAIEEELGQLQKVKEGTLTPQKMFIDSFIKKS